MAEKRPTDQQSPNLNSVLAEFLKAESDAPTVHDVEQRLELHVSGTSAYIPSYTRHIMDENHGAPVMALETRTYPETKRVFIQPAVNANDKKARKLRKDQTLGPAVFAFGVPLRRLGLKIPTSRRVILPLTPLETPDHGTVYWASFADIEVERRGVDMDGIAAVKREKVEQAKARKTARGKKGTASPGAGVGA